MHHGTPVLKVRIRDVARVSYHGGLNLGRMSKFVHINIKGKRIEEDLILLGGPKNNQITRKCLDRISNKIKILNQNNDTITWYPQEDKDHKNDLNDQSTNDPKVYIPVSQDKQVVEDYGMIIRTSNPFSDKDTMIYIFSGGHTFGTIAATEYYTTKVKRNIFQKSLPTNYFALIKCDVVNEQPCNLRLIHEWEGKILEEE